MLSAGIAALGLNLVSGTPYAAPQLATPKTLELLSFEAAHETTHVVDSFEIHSVNTLETVTVRYVDGELDPGSKQQLDHLMRCLRTDSATPIDPRLIDVLRDIAHEVASLGLGPLWLVSGYRSKEHYWDHNYHNRGQAADIRVEGMSAWKLRKIARKLGVKGVGWYPTTNMIHVDTRDEEYFWTDWSGPGQRGREIRSM